MNLKSIEVADDVNMDQLAKLSEGYSVSDIIVICRHASFINIRKRLKGITSQEMLTITNDDFKAAFQNTQPSISDDQIKKYETWNHFDY